MEKMILFEKAKNNINTNFEIQSKTLDESSKEDVELNLFGSVEHNDDNSDKWPDICDNPTEQDVLDYIALVLARNIDSMKAFKGGYMLNQILKKDSRLTHDIDFSINYKENYNEVKKVLKEIGDYFVRKELAKSYKIKEEISKTSSGGLVIYDTSGNVFAKVDVSVHNLFYGICDYNIKIGKVEAFGIERMLADKILVILSRQRFKRSKDLYDFYVLVNKYDFKYDELVYCIENRDNYDPSVWNNIPFSEEVLIQYQNAWNKLRLVSFKDGSKLKKPIFSDVIDLFNYIAIRIKNKTVASKWNHKDLTWEE